MTSLSVIYLVEYRFLIVTLLIVEWPSLRINICGKTNYNTHVFGMKINLNENKPQIVEALRKIYHSIFNSIDNDKGVTFFIDALSGTGKIFLINLMLVKVCQKKNIAFVKSMKCNCRNTCGWRENCTFYVLSAPWFYSTEKKLIQGHVPLGCSSHDSWTRKSIYLGTTIGKR